MKQTKAVMGMPITVEIIDGNVLKKNIDEVFDYFNYVDCKFSTYKQASEISKINSGLLKKENYSSDMKKVLLLCKKTKKETSGYFDILSNGKIDPSGIVKGWAIQNAANILRKKGFKNYYIEAGGDIQAFGKNKTGKIWTVGIKNPFKTNEIVKVLNIKDCAVATSGTYIRGQHIYNPHRADEKIKDIVSLTVIGPNIYDADRFATAAFAMGKKAIYFIESLPGFEAYMIDKNGLATMTSGLKKYIFDAKKN